MTYEIAGLDRESVHNAVSEIYEELRKRHYPLPQCYGSINGVNIHKENCHAITADLRCVLGLYE